MGLFDNLEFSGDGDSPLDMSIDELANLPSEGSDSEKSSIESTEDSKVEESTNEENKTIDADELKLSLQDILDDEVTEKDDTTVDKGNDKDPSSVNKETAGSSFLLLGNALAEEGILSEFSGDEFSKLVEDTGSEGKALLKLINDKIDESTKSIKDSYDEDYKIYKSLKEVGIPQDEAYELTSLASELDQLDDDILEESEETRESVLRLHFKNTTKWDDSRIDKHIEKLISNGEDIEEAKSALPELQKITKEAIQQKQQENLKLQEESRKQQEVAIKNIKDTFKGEPEIITGFKLTKAQALKAQELLLTPITLEDGSVTNPLYAERLKDPIGFDKKLAALYAAGAFEGKMTTQKISKNKALDEMEKTLSRNNKSSFKGNVGADNTALNEQNEMLNAKFLNSIRNNKQTI